MADTKVPRIEFDKENMERGSRGWVSTMQAIRSAFENYGCFEATYNGVGPKADGDMLRTMAELFNLDLETKRRFRSDLAFQGYSRLGDPLYNEAMAIPDVLAFKIDESFVRVLFPNGNRNVQICEAIHLYVTKIKELEKTVRRMVFESFGVEDYFEEQERSMKYDLRIMKYVPGASKESLAKNLYTHYDNTFLTILHEYGANALQVKVGNDNQWILPTFSGSSFLVLAGELFYGWSNARVQCTLHRVVMSDEEDPKAVRYSIALFSIQKGTVKIPSEMVDEEHPMMFKPFEWSGLTQAYLKDRDTPQYYDGGGYTVPTVKKHYAI